MIHFPRWKVWTIVVATLVSVLITLPNLIPSATLATLPSWVPSRQVTLGLDLQGGSHLLFQLDLDNVLSERLAGTADAVRSELNRGKFAFTDFRVEGQTLSFQLVDASQGAGARDAVRLVDPDLDVKYTESGAVTATRTPEMLQAIRNQAVSQSIEIIRRRVDETGTREPSIERQGADRILVQLPGVNDPERIKQLIGTTAKLTFRMVDQDASPADIARNRPPAGADLLPVDRSDLAGGEPRKIAVRKRVMVSGENLVDAQPGFGIDGQPVINFKFDSVGARRFGDATTENVGKLFAIVLDNKVLSAPVIREAITGGRGQISGSFTTQSAADLALLLRAGALPAPLVVVEERSVGPDLGADSIRAGAIASGLGFLMVCGFMALVYGKFGMMANAALIVNLIMIIAGMTLLQSTLTLPGIAGIVLTMGMAVDANVLIYERIREEQKLGRSVLSAVDLGFQRALVTIIDSNVTTLIATLFLFIFGSGPVKGFAVTLSIGILASMFTAVMLTRYIMIVWMRRARPQSVLI